MAKPAIFTVDDDPNVLQSIGRDLRHEYGGRFRLLQADSGQSALEAIRNLKLRGEPVALFLVDQRMPEMTGVEFLAEAIQVFPDAKRVLLTAYTDIEAAIRAINEVGIHHYLLKPWHPPEERLYPVLNDLLDDWLSAYRAPFEGLRVIGYRWAPASHEVRQFLALNQVPFHWMDVLHSTEARRLLEQTGLEHPQFPVVIFPDGSVLDRPSTSTIAERIGLSMHAQRPFYDLAIIGAGPSGLAAGVYAASEGLRTVLIEKQGPGGQAATSARIENYLGFPVGLSGADLARRATAQARRFGAEILAPVEAVGIRIEGQYRIVTLSDGREISCHALLITTGVTYRMLDVPGVNELTGAGDLLRREPGRYQITFVPAAIRSRDRLIGTGAPVLKQYERVCFDKPLISVPGQPLAEFVSPGHPLLDATIDLILERHRDILKRGAVLVDPTDPGTDIRALFYLEQSIHDAQTTRSGDRRVISQEVHFVEIDAQGRVRNAGSAPYLDYRAATADEIAQVQPHLEAEWLSGEHLEHVASSYAIEALVPRHLARVRERREELINKTMAAVKERLTKEINYWDFRAHQLRLEEKAGKPNARMNSQRAQQRADELAARLQRRMEELEQERQISASPPVMVGGALIVPAGLLWAGNVPADIRDRRITEQIAMRAVMETEIALGNAPRDVSADNLGYDIESRDGQIGQLRFIEVKGRRAGAETVTVTYNEIRALCNRPDTGILALVEIDDDGTPHPPRYVWRAFTREPEFPIASVNIDLHELLAMSEEPK